MTELKQYCDREIITWLNTLSQADEPSWGAPAQEVICDLANAIAHWLVVNYDHSDWVQIRKGIEDATRSRLAPLATRVESHELPGASAGGIITNKRFNFENGEYPRV